MTDDGSKASPKFGNIGGPPLLERYELGESVVTVACRVCGRAGVLVNPFEPG